MFLKVVRFATIIGTTFIIVFSTVLELPTFAIGYYTLKTWIICG
jgi:hypothetical protein